MVSNIDETKPVTGIDQPAKVMRDNFTIAKIEITELQARKFESDGSSIMTGPLELVSFTLAELPPAIDNEGNLVYVSDSSPPSPFFSDGLTWSAIGTGVGGLSNIVEDTTPQLGGELDAQNNKITNLGTPTLAADAATKLYVDTEILSASSVVEIVNDLTPQLGGELDAQNNKIINLAIPTAGGDATNKAYVDSLSAGLDPKESVRVATTADLGFTFVDNGGVGDTLTAGAPGTTAIDTITLADGDRVLVKDESDAKQNGIYIASDTDGGSATILTRATDQDGSPSNEVSAGNFTFVETGATNASTGWVVIGDGVLTINTDDVNWAKFSDVSGALSNLIEDLTPQLGGDLDVNGFSIVSVSDGDIPITPDGSGTVILDGLIWPIADGSSGQVLTTDGGGNLSFASSGGLDNVVEDLTPQLGGNLDANFFDITISGEVVLSFASGGETGVNNVEVVNGITGFSPIIRSVGADTNIDLTVEPKGTGDVVVGLTGPSQIRGDTNESLTIGGGDSDATATGGDTIIISGDGSGAFVSGAIFITPGTGGSGDGSLILDGLIWPIVDGSSGQALTTNGSGTLGFASVGAASSISNVVEDTTPQLGGNLDNNFFGISTDGNVVLGFASGGESAVNNLEIVHATTGSGPIIRSVGSDSSIDLNIDPKGTGAVVLDGLSWPTVDGSNGQVLTTDGGGQLSFAAGGGGSAFTTQIASSTPIAAVDDDEILVDTVALAVTVNLPGSPTLGDRVRIVDGAGNASTNNITVGRNGEVIMGVAADFIINVNNAGAEFVYMNVTNGWRVVNNV